jgi:hypothetical protein
VERLVAPTTFQTLTPFSMGYEHILEVAMASQGGLVRQGICCKTAEALSQEWQQLGGGGRTKRKNKALQTGPLLMPAME